MKTRYSALDVVAIVPELKAKLCTGWRVNQVYDCDTKTYLFKLNKSIVQMKKDDDPVNVDEEVANKMTLIVESGIRIYTTDYDYNKSPAPSNFATKLRKHLRNKRVVDIRQVGADRLIEIQFGSKEAANYLIIELYDKGNLILTDYQKNVLTILRWRKQLVRQPVETDQSNEVQGEDNSNVHDSENLKVGQPYPYNMRHDSRLVGVDNEQHLIEILNNSRKILSEKTNYKKRNKMQMSGKDDQFEVNLKDLFNPFVIYGSSLLEDKIIKHVFNNDPSVKKCCVMLRTTDGNPNRDQVEDLASKLLSAFKDADNELEKLRTRTNYLGYLVQRCQKTELAKKINGVDEKNANTNIDFFPILSCAQRRVELDSDELTYQEYESFDKAVDIYYSNLESQKLDSKALVAERDAMRKLENLKLDQEKRLDDLAQAQKEDEEKARLIELNSDKVESALLIIRSMVANQTPWNEIWDTIKEAQSKKDPIATSITGVKFDRNEFSMKLSDPYEEPNSKKPNFKIVDIDLSLSAFANAKKFFTKRRTAVNKEHKTREVSRKAYKNVEKKTKEMLKEVAVTTNITKARKRYWFENFLWFLSSDGYLVVAGRDAEQNELLVKRYMKKNDLYVHADLHGASTVIIKNEFDAPVPHKTCIEAGTMAVCCSSAWDAKIAIKSYFVYPHQVSKSAPTGEYLTPGAFMIRGEKNYLPISNLVLGFGFLFKLDDESIEKRKASRSKRESMSVEDNNDSINEAPLSDNEGNEQIAGDNEDDQSDASSSGSEEVTTKADHDGYENDDFSDDDYDEKKVEYSLVDTLTEFPMEDDVLLYAIPVCGPYSAIQNYKYKVKVVPGPTKRGKAAKTCLNMFLCEKKASRRERDLLRAYKNQDFARNMPGKVKISSTNMTKLVVANKKKNKK